MVPALPQDGSLLADGGQDLGLLLAAGLLRAILAVLLGAAAHLVLLVVEASALQAVLGLELLHLVHVVVNEAEAAAAVAAKVVLEAEEDNRVVVVHLVIDASLV